MRGGTGASPAAYAQASQAIANMRGVFIIILVSFHASLAYLGSTAGPAPAFDAPPYAWLAFPVVDERRFFGFDLYCAWEDVHVMALMFFLSGLFVAPSFRRKGAAKFAADRVWRLGLPFLFSVTTLTPLGLYPVFHRLNPDGGLGDYLDAYRRLPFLPNGPGWFLWLLLAISLAAGGLAALFPRALDGLGALAADARRRPGVFLTWLAGAAILAYVPLTLAVGPFDWFERGAFSFQESRPLLYATFFLAGVAVGANGLGGGLLAPDGVLQARWRRLAILSPACLFGWMGVTGVVLNFPAFAPLAMRFVSALLYVGASVSGVMLLLALSVRFATQRIRWLEPLARNALGIFIVHYPPLVWSQYAMTFVDMPAILKATIVFTVTLGSSLILAIAMRRVPVIARLIGEDAARPVTAAAPARLR